MKEIHLLILKHLMEGQRPVGALFMDGGTDEHHFSNPCALPLPWQVCIVHIRDVTLLSGSGGPGLALLDSTGVQQSERQFFFWQVTTPRALQRHHTETHPHSVCEKGLFICHGASTCEVGFGFATNLEVMGGAISESRLGDVILALPLGLANSSLVPPRKEPIQLSGALILPLSPMGHLRLPGLEANRVYDCDPTGLYLHTF